MIILYTMCWFTSVFAENRSAKSAIIAEKKIKIYLSKEKDRHFQSIFFSGQNLNLLNMSIDMFYDVYRGGNINDEQMDFIMDAFDSNENKSDPVKDIDLIDQSNILRINIGSIIYISNDQWSLWVNGENVNSKNIEQSSMMKHMSICKINSNGVCIRWVPKDFLNLFNIWNRRFFTNDNVLFFNDRRNIIMNTEEKSIYIKISSDEIFDTKKMYIYTATK